MENQQNGHKRRVRYSGTHPKRYQEKYKELHPEKYSDTVSKVSINVVWAYISYLRRKLSALGANVKITASRGRGYMLEVEEKE